MTTVRRTSLASQVSDALRARLIAGEEGWRVGEKIPPEHQLSQELGVGRSTIREAVRVLANEDWLETRQGTGTFVLRSAAMPSGLLSRLRRAEMIEVFEARHGLEVEAARLAARRRTPEDLAAIEAALDRRLHTDPADSGRAFVESDIAFHAAVVAACHNSVMIELFGSFATVLAESLLDLTAHHFVSDEATAAHVDLVEAIRAGDAAGAARAAAAQFLSAETSLRAADENQG